MRLLCVDIRNARTTFGLFADEALVDTWQVSTDVRRTADEWGLLVTRLLDAEAPDLGRVCVSSTVPAALHEVRAMVETYLEGVAMVNSRNRP